MSEAETINSDRASTGIEGLDYILKGGLSRNRLYLVQGNPGTGKTTMGLQFLLEGERKGDIGFKEAHRKTRAHDSGISH